MAARVSTPSSIAAVRVPVKTAQGSELTEAQTTYNKLIHDARGIGERADSLLKTTFKALRHVNLDRWRIGVITKAALVPLHVEHDRPLLGGYPRDKHLPIKARCRS